MLYLIYKLYSSESIINKVSQIKFSELKECIFLKNNCDKIHNIIYSNEILDDSKVLKILSEHHNTFTTMKLFIIFSFSKKKMLHLDEYQSNPFSKNFLLKSKFEYNLSNNPIFKSLLKNLNFDPITYFELIIALQNKKPVDAENFFNYLIKLESNHINFISDNYEKYIEILNTYLSNNDESIVVSNILIEIFNNGVRMKDLIIDLGLNSEGNLGKYIKLNLKVNTELDSDVDFRLDNYETVFFDLHRKKHTKKKPTEQLPKTEIKLYTNEPISIEDKNYVLSSDTELNDVLENVFHLEKHNPYKFYEWLKKKVINLSGISDGLSNTEKFLFENKNKIFLEEEIVRKNYHSLFHLSKIFILDSYMLKSPEGFMIALIILQSLNKFLLNNHIESDESIITDEVIKLTKSLRASFIPFQLSKQSGNYSIYSTEFWDFFSSSKYFNMENIQKFESSIISKIVDLGSFAHSQWDSILSNDEESLEELYKRITNSFLLEDFDDESKLEYYYILFGLYSNYSNKPDLNTIKLKIEFFLGDFRLPSLPQPPYAMIKSAKDVTFPISYYTEDEELKEILEGEAIDEGGLIKVSSNLLHFKNSYNYYFYNLFFLNKEEQDATKKGSSNTLLNLIREKILTFRTKNSQLKFKIDDTTAKRQEMYFKLILESSKEFKLSYDFISDLLDKKYQKYVDSISKHSSAQNADFTATGAEAMANTILHSNFNTVEVVKKWIEDNLSYIGEFASSRNVAIKEIFSEVLNDLFINLLQKASLIPDFYSRETAIKKIMTLNKSLSVLLNQDFIEQNKLHALENGCEILLLQ